MKLTKAQVRNFRILNEFEIDFEDILSLVIGKNNSGKTSFLVILEKFLSDSKPEFSFDDFNIEQQKIIIALDGTAKKPDEYHEPNLSLKLYISYDEKDNIADASALLLDLDENNKHFVVLFEFVLTYENYLRLTKDYSEYKSKFKGNDRHFDYYVTKNIKRYFIVRISALEYGNEDNYKSISLDTIRAIITMKTIGARRDVDNSDGRSLSALAYRYYNNKNLEEEFPELEQELKKQTKI